MADGEAEEWQEGEGDEGVYGEEEEEEEGGEVAEEEEEIHRLEEARLKRKQRFNHATTKTSTSTSQPTASHSGTSAAKLAVARAAGMAIADDDDAIVDDSDELLVATAETRIKGQCTTMCTRKEVLDRLESHTISLLEVEEGQSPAALTTADSVPLAVKKYRRAAAAQQLDPRDVRTPATLLAACQHLIDRVVDRRDVGWHEVHRFVTDRFRAVRSDFVCQAVVSADSVQCLEWMVRFHILAMDVLRREPTETFDPIQNMEKLTQTLTSLRLLYRDNASSPTPFPTPCQAEMQGYLLFTQFNRNFFSTFTPLSSALKSSAPVQFALATYNAMRENNYALFFSLLRRASYLQLCLCLPFIARVRERALRTVCRAYQRFSVSAVSELLCMDDESKALDMLRWYGVSVEPGVDEIVFVSGGAKGGRRQQFVPNANGVYSDDHAERLVASKRPATKRLAIRTTLEGLSGAALPASSENIMSSVARRSVPHETAPRSVRPPSAVSKPPSSTPPPLPPPSSFPSSQFKPPTNSVPATTATISSPPFRLKRDTAPPPPLPFPSFTAVPPQSTVLPPPAASTFMSTSQRTPPHTNPTFIAFPPAPSSVPNPPLPFSSQPFIPSQPSPRNTTAFAPGIPSLTTAASAFPHSSPFVAPPSTTALPPTSPLRATNIVSPSSSSTLPLLRSLSTQQRDERLQREAEQSLLRQQEQLERERTAAQLRLASQLRVATLLRRWQQAVRVRRVERAERERRLIAADRWYRQGVQLVCLLQWHGLWRGREERRESDAAMRRAMSEGQHGLSAVHAGLMTMEERLRQLYGDQAASTLRIDSTHSVEADDDLPLHDDEAAIDDDSHTTLASSATGLDVADLVMDEMLARNPAHNELFFHLLISVGDKDTPYSHLLLNKLSRHTSSSTRDNFATPRRNNQLLLLPSHESDTTALPLSSYTVPVSPSPSARQLHVRVQREEDGPASFSRHIGYQGAVFLLSSALGLEDVPSVVSHPDPNSSLPSTMSAFVVPPASRFQYDRQRLATFISTLHRYSALPLVILYPLAPSTLSYMQRYGSASSAYFQQHAALMLTHCLHLPEVDAQVVADISISPLFLPATLFSSSFTALSDAPLFGYNDGCLGAAINQLAVSSPPHPVLHRIDVPDTLEQRLGHCVGYLKDTMSRLSALLTSAVSTSATTAAASLLTFTPQTYVDYFNASVRSFKRRLFTAGVKEVSWPPEGSGLSLSASPSSPAAQSVRQLLSLLPLPPFPSSSSSTAALDWSWTDCHSAIVAYLSSYRTLLALTAHANGDEDEVEQQSAIDSDLYTLYRKAHDLFATHTPSQQASEPQSVHQAAALDQLAKLAAWLGWLLALLEHRLSELTMHPLMLDAQQHFYSLIATDTLIELTDTDRQSYVLPVDVSAMELDLNGDESEMDAEETLLHGAVNAAQQAVVKRRKLHARTNGNTGKSKQKGALHDDMSQALVRSGSANKAPATRKDGLWLALEEEKMRQSRLNAMLDEIEANFNQ